MITRNTKVPFIIASFILVGGLVPAAAFADDHVGVNLPVSADVHVQAAGDGETGDGAEHDSMSVNASANATVRSSDETDHEGSHTSSTTRRHGDREDRHASSTMYERDHESNNDQGENEDDNEIEIDHESADNASTTIEHSDEVSNRGELRSFLNHVVKEDDRIGDVSVSSTSVETHYSMPSRFLWAIPANITADVTVNNNGTVTVTYPWYAFLFATHGSDLENHLTASSSVSTGSGTTTTLSASAQAHLLDLLFANLKASADH